MIDFKNRKKNKLAQADPGLEFIIQYLFQVIKSQSVALQGLYKIDSYYLQYGELVDGIWEHQITVTNLQGKFKKIILRSEGYGKITSSTSSEATEYDYRHPTSFHNLVLDISEHLKYLSDASVENFRDDCKTLTDFFDSYDDSDTTAIMYTERMNKHPYMDVNIDGYNFIISPDEDNVWIEPEVGSVFAEESLSVESAVEYFKKVISLLSKSE